MSDRLESELHELGEQVAFPPTPDLSAGVHATLAERGAARRGLGWRPVWRSVAVATAALLLIAGTSLALGIGLRGLGILFVDEPRQSIGERLQLGQRVTLAQGQQQVPYRILLPAATIGQPDEVYVDTAAGLDQVTLIYHSDAEPPAGADPEVDLLITQFVATFDQPMVKEIGPGTSVEEVTVSGERGLWIEGEPHALVYRGPSGAVIDDRVRLVGDVLVWQRGDHVLRLEGAYSLEQALAIAESMQ
jgi:hypothetical protein